LISGDSRPLFPGNGNLKKAALQRKKKRQTPDYLKRTLQHIGMSGFVLQLCLIKAKELYIQAKKG
jgi:hypothetical protein